MHTTATTKARVIGGANFKVRLFAGGAVAALFATAAPVAYAQDTGIETVVVSSSRITANGFSAPTPTTVVGVADLQQNAAPNVFDTIAELPSLSGSSGTQTGTGGTSSANNGLSSFNLRGLGTIRTLTLIDSQRVVPAYVSGITDVSEFPQLLIQRVDVVTGGASASWGSDAVGGVVNFVTDKKFNGIKGNLQGGISTYGDDSSLLAQVAAGTTIFGDKGHIEGSLEFYRNDGVPPPNLPGGGLANGRCCSTHPGTLAYTPTTTPAGVPENTPIVGSQTTSASEYGLITAGPLSGTAFLQGGQATAPFQYGSPCVGTTCVGGDLTNSAVKATVDDPITRGDFYTRVSYDLTPGIEIYGTFNFGNVWSADTPSTGNRTGSTVQCGAAAGGANYYLPASVNAACVANKITTFTMGSSYDQWTAISPIRIVSLRQQRRYVVGTDGTFNLLGNDWTFDAYAEHGENGTSTKIHDMILQARYTAAVDAIAGPNGTPVCRSAAAQASGCVTINPFGGVPISQQAFNYVTAGPGGGPYSLSQERQEAASFAINGTPFKDWAGDVALAFGAEYREEAYITHADPYGNGLDGTNSGAAYPADSLLDLVNGNNWLAGDFHDGNGDYHVQEAFVEVGVPLVDTPAWGKANLDIAGRGTNYSTSGYVDTWKIGTTWDTPVSGLRLRALQSRDVRAPNLSELFAAPLVQNNSVINRLLPATSPNVTVLNENLGNANLRPETAQTTELGVIYQPDYLPGFNISVDYFRVGIKKEIAKLTNQQEVDLCQISGNTSYCPVFFLNGVIGTANPSYVVIQPFNLASQVTDGFDIETSYQFDLQDWNIPGNFVFRALTTHVSKFITNTGVPGAAIAETAGSTVPLWKGFLTQSWTSDPFSFNIAERFYSEGVLNPNGIVCQAPNCPVPTIQNPTYSSDNFGGQFYMDIGGSYKISDLAEAYFKIQNITNLIPQGQILSLTNNLGQVDPIGRIYRIGVRFNLAD